MLSKINRLRRYQDFNTVYQKGKRRIGSHLTLRVLKQIKADKSEKIDRPHQKSLPTGPSRIGISISQKVSKKAVVRNRIKRQIRAACRALLPQLDSQWDIIIGVHPNATKCNYAQLKEELQQLLSGVNLLKIK